MSPLYRKPFIAFLVISLAHAGVLGAALGQEAWVVAAIITCFLLFYVVVVLAYALVSPDPEEIEKDRARIARKIEKLQRKAERV